MTEAEVSTKKRRVCLSCVDTSHHPAAYFIRPCRVRWERWLALRLKAHIWTFFFEQSFQSETSENRGGESSLTMWFVHFFIPPSLAKCFHLCRLVCRQNCMKTTQRFSTKLGWRTGHGHHLVPIGINGWIQELFLTFSNSASCFSTFLLISHWIMFGSWLKGWHILGSLYLSEHTSGLLGLGGGIRSTG